MMGTAARWQLTFTLLTLAAGCAGVSRGSRASDEHLPIDPIPSAESPLSACRKWKRTLGAHVSYVSTTADAKKILVSTSGEPHHRDSHLRMFDGRAKPLWTKELAEPARGQALAPDGSIAVVSTYDGVTAAYSPKGAKLWTREHFGRPVILPNAKRILVINDDDDEPKLAFVSYNYAGARIASVRVDPQSTDEPLEQAVSPDESIVAVLTTESRVLAYSPDGAFLGGTKLDGDGVTVEAGPKRVYAVVTPEGKRAPRKLEAFDLGHDGALHLAWSSELDRQFESAKLSGNTLYLYGNTAAGQALAGFDTANGKMLWKRSYPLAAAYSSFLFSAAARG
jgi:hypothetical protein